MIIHIEAANELQMNGDAEEESIIIPMLSEQVIQQTAPKQFVPKLDLTKAKKIQEILIKDDANKQQQLQQIKPEAQVQQPDSKTTRKAKTVIKLNL